MCFSIKAFTLVSMLTISVVKAYPSGAPQEICDSLKPNHRVSAQSGLSPYQVLAKIERSLSGVNEVHLTINSPEGTSFRGFAIQARIASHRNSTVDGNFKVIDEQNSHSISCNGRVNDTLTHSNRNDKQEMTAIWFPPENFNEEIVFLATIVKDKKTFWVNQLSKVIAISHVSDSVPNEHSNHQKNELTTPKIEKHSDGIGEKQLNSSSITYLNLFAIVWMTFMLFIQ